MKYKGKKIKGFMMQCRGHEKKNICGKTKIKYSICWKCHMKQCKDWEEIGREEAVEKIFGKSGSRCVNLSTCASSASAMACSSLPSLFAASSAMRTIKLYSSFE